VFDEFSQAPGDVACEPLFGIGIVLITVFVVSVAGTARTAVAASAVGVDLVLRYPVLGVEHGIVLDQIRAPFELGDITLLQGEESGPGTLRDHDATIRHKGSPSVDDGYSVCPTVLPQQWRGDRVSFSTISAPEAYIR